jgi:hypothetical protein
VDTRSSDGPVWWLDHGCVDSKASYQSHSRFTDWVDRPLLRRSAPLPLLRHWALNVECSGFQVFSFQSSIIHPRSSRPRPPTVAPRRRKGWAQFRTLRGWRRARDARQRPGVRSRCRIGSAVDQDSCCQRWCSFPMAHEQHRFGIISCTPVGNIRLLPERPRCIGAAVQDAGAISGAPTTARASRRVRQPFRLRGGPKVPPL